MKFNNTTTTATLIIAMVFLVGMLAGTLIPDAQDTDPLPVGTVEIIDDGVVLAEEMDGFATSDRLYALITTCVENDGTLGITDWATLSCEVDGTQYFIDYDWSSYDQSSSLFWGLKQQLILE